MITIKEPSQSALVIKKSRFLGFAFRAHTEADAQEILIAHKKQHRDASHNCFAYVLANGAMRCSDDGEPQGTAGQPMLEVLTRSGLSDVLLIVTRYFGGTLLGAPGLVRAYTQSASDALAAAPKVELIECSVFTCTFAYDAWAKAEKRLQDAGFMIDDTDYAASVTVLIAALPGTEPALSELITSLSFGQSSLIPAGTHTIEKPI